MLVLTRKSGQQIVIPEAGVTLTVLSTTGKAVRLGFSAPRAVAVHRREVLDRPQGKGASGTRHAVPSSVSP